MKTVNHFHPGKVVSVLLLCLLYSAVSYSQKPSKKETISYINQKLAPSCVIEMNGGTIIATYTDNGKKVREDKVLASDLDTIFVYEAAEKILSIPCVRDYRQGVTRTLFEYKIKKQYSRLSFVVDGDKQELKYLKRALLHLIRINSEFRYNDYVILE